MVHALLAAWLLVAGLLGRRSQELLLRSICLLLPTAAQDGIVAFSGYEKISKLYVCHFDIPPLSSNNTRKGRFFTPPLYHITENICVNRQLTVKVFLKATFNPFERTFQTHMQLKSLPKGRIVSKPEHWVCSNMRMIQQVDKNYNIQKDNPSELEWPTAVLFRSKKETGFADEVGCLFQEEEIPCVCRWLNKQDRKPRQGTSRHIYYKDLKSPKLKDDIYMIFLVTEELLIFMDSNFGYLVFSLVWIVVTSFALISLFMKFLWDENLYKANTSQQRDVKTRAHLKRALKLQAVNSRKKMELEEIKKLWIEEMIEDKKIRDYEEKMKPKSISTEVSEKFE